MKLLEKLLLVGALLHCQPQQLCAAQETANDCLSFVGAAVVATGAALGAWIICTHRPAVLDELANCQTLAQHRQILMNHFNNESFIPQQGYCGLCGARKETITLICHRNRKHGRFFMCESCIITISEKYDTLTYPSIRMCYPFMRMSCFICENHRDDHYIRFAYDCGRLKQFLLD